MNKTLEDKLVKINKDFYQEVGANIWNPDPNYFWEGWEISITKLNKIDYFKSNKPLKVLDLGCGSGRFLNFLFSQNLVVGSYIGVDNSPEMLEIAKQNLTKINSTQNQPCQLEFLEADLLQLSSLSSLEGQEFDIIVAFGVFHHLPNLQNRLNLMQVIFDLLSKNGLFIWTTWQFLDSPRLLKRVLDAEKVLEFGQNQNINLSDMEKGDHILDWVKLQKSFRYSHYFFDEELKVLNSNFKLLDNFLTDGRNSNQNRYFLCSKF